MPLAYHYTRPAYTEEAQLGYQGYFVYQVSYVQGLGVKVARCATGAEKAIGVILRGGEYAATGVPQSLSIVKQGASIPVIAGAGGLEVGDLVAPAAGGRGVAVTADGAGYNGVCVKAADEGDIALVDVEPYATISDPS